MASPHTKAVRPRPPKNPSGDGRAYDLLNSFVLSLTSLRSRSQLAWYIASQIAEPLGFEDCVVLLRIPGTDTLRQVAAIGAKQEDLSNDVRAAMDIPFGRGLTGYAAQNRVTLNVPDTSKDPRFLNDFPDARSELCVPIVNNNEVLGLIDLTDPSTGAFTAEQADFFETIAALAATQLTVLQQERLSHLSEQLARSEERLKDFLDTASDWLWETDETGRFTFVSSTTMFRSNPTETRNLIMGRTMPELRDGVGPFSVEMESYSEEAKAQKPFRKKLMSIFKKGEKPRHFKVSGTPLFGPNNQFRGYRGTSHEVTEQILADTRINDIYQIVDAMPDAIAFFDADDRIFFTNKAFQHMHENVADSIKIGRKGTDHIYALAEAGMIQDIDYDLDIWIKETVEKHLDPGDPIEFYRPGNGWFRGQEKLFPNGQRALWISDINGIKETEREAIEARKAADAANAAKSNFLANMSHEIRTPMNGILGMSELLLRNLQDPTLREKAKTVVLSANSLLRIIDDILDFSKIEAGMLEVDPYPTNLRNSLTGLLRFHKQAAHAKALDLKLRTDDALDAVVMIDEGRLRQVLSNLISNAIKFTPTDGRNGKGLVQIIAEPYSDKWLQIQVIDNGIGISAEAVQHIFSPFTQAESDTTRRFGGTGLGLTISHELSQLMGGNLSCASGPEGSTFTLHLPLDYTDAPQIEETEPDVHAASAQKARNLNILVVEDNPINAQVISKQLQSLGFGCTLAGHGEEGLQKWAEARNEQSRFDLVLTDCHMPNMDGYELAGRIRRYEAKEADEGCKIIAITANALKSELQKCLDAGMDDYLVKPVSIKALTDVLNAV